MDSAVTATAFLDKFEQSYLRNNRRGGQKNLRCFPQCCPHGHSCSGFCGRDVRLSVQHSCANELMALGEFIMRGKEPVDMDVGSTHSLEQLVQNTRAKSYPLRRFIGGVDKHGDSILHFRPTCWHYGWRSNKHATNKKHTLRVYLLRRDATTQTATVMSIVDSPEFSLFSSKCLAKESYKRANPAVRAADLRRPAKRPRRTRSPVVEPPQTPPPENAADSDDEICTVHLPPKLPLPIFESNMGRTPKSPISVFDIDMLQDVPECSLDEIIESLDVDLKSSVPSCSLDFAHLLDTEFMNLLTDDSLRF